MFSKNERTLQIENLQKEFDGAKGIFLTDFNKIDVARITELRSDLRKNGVKYIVVKNTLARIAMDRSGKTELSKLLKGPVGVAVSMQDGVAPAKVIRDFRKKYKDLLEVKAAYVDGSLFNAEDALKLADLPSREVLLSQFLSCLKAPMTNFAGSLSGIFTKFVGTLEAVKNQKESN